LEQELHFKRCENEKTFCEGVFQFEAGPMLSRGRILVVDDDAIVGRCCQEILAAEGHDVHVAYTGDEALSWIETRAIDVALLDLKVPGCSGLNLVRAVRKASPLTEVVVITGYPSIENAKESIRLGAFDFVTKPFVPGIVCAVVSQALTRKPWTMERWCYDGCVQQTCTDRG
jgi:DNA-binding NtrC family response regulator